MRTMFNWLTRQQKSNLPEPTALETQKTKQIEQLRSFNQNVSEIHRDAEYRVNFVVNGSSISLYISLPPQFPQDKPVVKVSPTLTHPWVNENLTVTGCPGLNDFVIHSDLGRIVRDIIEEFQNNPPVITPPKHPFQVGNSSFQYSASSSPGGNQPPSGYQPPYPVTQNQPPVSVYNIPPVAMPTLPAMASASQLPPYSTQDENSSVYTMPDIPPTIAEIRGMSMQELNELSENENKLLELLKTLPQVHQLSQDRANFCAQNEQLATDNLSQRPVLEERKKLLLEKYDELNELRARFDHLSKRQDVLINHFDVTTIRDNLKVAAVDAEESAEAVADKFLEGSMSVDDFKKQFMSQRTVGYLRRAKEEKMALMALS